MDPTDSAQTFMPGNVAFVNTEDHPSLWDQVKGTEKRVCRLRPSACVLVIALMSMSNEQRWPRHWCLVLAEGQVGVLNMKHVSPVRFRETE